MSGNAQINSLIAYEVLLDSNHDTENLVGGAVFAADTTLLTGVPAAVRADGNKERALPCAQARQLSCTKMQLPLPPLRCPAFRFPGDTLLRPQIAIPSRSYAMFTPKHA